MAEEWVENAGMYLRAYRGDDFERLYALDRVCFPPRFRFPRGMMRRVVEAPAAVVVLACEQAMGEEQLLGFCAAELEAEGEERWGYVATLDVAPESRRRGVGRALMRRVEEDAAGKGVPVMLLHVYAGNPAAVGLYEGLAYVRAGREQGFYGAGFDAWVYRKGIA